MRQSKTSWSTRNWAVAAIVIAAVLPGVVFGQERPTSKQQRITVEQGRQLVYLLLKPTGCNESKCSVDRIENSYFPQYYFFYGTWPNPVGSPHIGTWAVDPATGDVFDANACVQYRTADLTKLQVSLRNTMGIKHQTYVKLKHRPPMCESGEKVRIGKH